MPWFSRKGEDQKQREAAARQQMEAAIAALESGDVLPATQRRLAEVRERPGSFTTGLSVNEFLLARQSGFRPLAQVMGSSVFHVGWQSLGYGSGSGELTVVSQAYNEVRRLALTRLVKEALEVGANVVTGVHLTPGPQRIGQSMVEFQALGTAAVMEPVEPHSGVALTNLSGQDLWKLHEAGYRPLGIAAGSVVYYVVPGWGNRQAMQGWGQWYNQELTDFTQGLSTARHLAMRQVHGNARAMPDSAGVVGVQIDREQDEFEIEMGGQRRTDMIFTFHVVGTVIGRRGDRPAPAARPAINLKP